MANIGGVIALCLPAALFIWFVLHGYRALAIDIDADARLWTSLFGFPVCAGAGILLTWLFGSFRLRGGPVQTDALRQWSARAVVGAILLVISTLLMGGGLAVASLLRGEMGDWNPAPAELIFTIVFLGGGLSTSVLATIAGWLARREIRRASFRMRGWQAACAAACFWPGVALGVLLLLAMAWGYSYGGAWPVILMSVVVLAAIALGVVTRRAPSVPTPRPANPWPRRIFWLIVAIVVVLPSLLAVSLLVPYLALQSPPPQPFEPRASVTFDNVTAVEDLVTFSMSVIVDPPEPELRICYLGRPLESSRVASVPQPGFDVIVGPAARLEEGSGQCTSQLGVRESGPASLSWHVALVLPDANAARQAAGQIQSRASEKRDPHVTRKSKLKLFTLDTDSRGPYVAWLEFPSNPRGTAVVVNRQPDVDAPRAEQPSVVGDVIVPYGFVAEFDVLLRNGDVERPLPQMSFFAVHDDPQRRQEPVSVPVAWSLSPGEQARSPVVGRLRAGLGVEEDSVNVSYEVPGTELVAWRMSPGYLTDQALMEGLRDLPPDRWLEPVGPLGPGETCTSRLFYGEPKLPRDDPAHEAALTMMLRISVHRLPADWTNPRPGIHVQAGSQWREYLGLRPETQEAP